MDFFIQYIVLSVFYYKYLTIFMVSFLSALMVPLPAGIVLMTSSAFASYGYLNLWIIILVSSIANILGDNIIYWVSYFYGEKVFSFLGFRKVLKSSSFKSFDQQFRNYPGVIIFASRFQFLATLSVNILSGLGKVSYKKFLLFEIPGSIIQVSMYVFIGYLFGYNWQLISGIMGITSTVVVLIFVLLLVTFRKRIFRN